MKKDKKIFKACYNSDFNAVQSYISHGKDINQENDSGDTPLIIASKKGNVHIVKLLINSGADVNHQNENGRTALITASIQTYYEYLSYEKRDKINRNFEQIVSLLLQNGAEINICDNFDKNVLDYADEIKLKILFRSIISKIDIFDEMKYKSTIDKLKEDTQNKKNNLNMIISKTKEENKYPFLLFGIYNADDFEWINAVVRFKSNLTDDQINKMSKIAPVPEFYKHEVEKNHSRSKMTAVDGQYLDVVDWIIKANKFSPIEFVYLEKNDMAENNYLDWHSESINRINDYIADLSKDNLFNMDLYEKRLFKNALIGIFEYSGINDNNIPDELCSLVYSAKKLIDHFENNKIDKALDIYNLYMIDEEKGEIFNFFDSINEKNTKQVKNLVSFAEAALESKDFTSINNANMLPVFTYSAVLANDDNLISQIQDFVVNQVSPEKYINYFVNYTYHLLKSVKKKSSKSKEKFNVLIKLFEILLDIDSSHQSYELYTNALYVLQNDNTGLPINTKLNEKFLNKSLPFGPSNPAIYYNAGCLYIEMKKYDKAAECFKNAKKYKYNGYDKMLEEIQSNSFYSDFRNSKYFKKIYYVEESMELKELNDQLIAASRESNFELIKKMIESGADVNTREYGSSGVTPLYYASENGDLKIAEFLIKTGADVNADCFGETALNRALQNGHFDVVNLLIENNADIQKKDEDGNTAFTKACEKGNYPIAAKLFKKIKLSKNDKNYAFIKACKGGNIEIVNMLLEKGADVKAKNKDGSALMFASRSGNFELVKLLIENGADVNVKEQYGDTALIWAAGFGSVEIVDMLIKSGADINVKGNGNYTALMEACKKKKVEIVKYLLKNGAYINTKNNLGDDAISYSIFSKELIKLFIESGADLNNSPVLEHAIDSGDNEIISLLKESGVNINNDSPLAAAVSNGNMELIKLLLNEGADINKKNKYDNTPLLVAVENESVEIVKLLIENEADITIKDEYGTAPLIKAVKKGNITIAKLLLEKDADINDTNNNGQTALFFAPGSEMCKFLIDNNANIEAKDQYGDTPLIYISIWGELSTVKTLIENGAFIDAVNNHGKTALMEACRGIAYDPAGYTGNYEIAEYLLSKNARIDIKDKKGKKALDYAKENLDEDIVDLFKNTK